MKTNNPGASILTVEDGVPTNMRSMFFLLNRYNEDGTEEFYEVDYVEQFGLRDLTAEAIHEFKLTLDDSKKKTL